MSARMKILVTSLVAVVVLAGAAAWWFLGDDPPAAVTLDAAVSSVDDADDADDSTASSSTGTASDDGIDGTWAVDTGTGDLDDGSASGTFVGFRITEELAGIGTTEAVGRTGEVTGSATIAGTTLTAATFEADTTTITTNDSRRDDEVQEALETRIHPTATFVLTDPVELGEDAADGGSVSVTATGELTIHGVTEIVEIPLQAQLVDDTVVVVGALDITFADYGVEIPSSRVVLSVEDHGTLELQLLLRRA